jgi:sulfide:quinone oxidoreductase
MQSQHKKTTFRIAILGGGTAGISLASLLVKWIPANQIAIVEPSSHHYYQPLWTLVGAGEIKKEASRRETADYLPRGVCWIQDKVAKILPQENQVQLESGNSFSYQYLVVATGLVTHFDRIEGLQGNLNQNGVCSIYDYEGAEKTAEMLSRFKHGEAIFTMPPVPIKCAGAPQKIMYLADDIFRRNGVRKDIRISFFNANKVIFGVPQFAATLSKVIERKNIEVNLSHRLVKIDAKKKVATFATESGEVNRSYQFLHVVPPMSAHDFIINSELAADEGPQKGWLKVNRYTLQHETFSNVFGLGDVTGVPNSKTGAAIRKQTPVVNQNLKNAIKGEALTAQYDGYSACPLITGFGKVVLAEFGYDNKLMPSFPGDPSKERRAFWILKKYVLPLFYWSGMLKGKDWALSQPSKKKALVHPTLSTSAANATKA